MILPKSAVLELTYKCNHCCKFCSCPWYAEGNAYPVKPELELSEWKRVINKLYDLGVESISISGGECLLKDCLPDILLHIKKEAFDRGLPKDIVLISNGLLMNNDYLQLFKHCNVHLSMSLPGLKSFKYHTGVDNAEGVLHWFQEAHQLQMSTTVNVTVTQQNYDELFETLSVGLLNGANTVLLNRFLPGGRGLKYLNELLLTPEQLNGMLDTAEEVLTLANRYGQTGTEFPLCIIKNPDNYKRMYYGMQCAAAKGFFVIDPAGQIRTCNHSPHIVGNIFDEDIITDKTYWNIFAQSNYHPTMCNSCKSITKCDCGCREVANILTGSPSNEDMSAKIVGKNIKQA